MSRRVSLRWRITVGLVVFQVLALIISSLVTIAVAFQAAPLGVAASINLTNVVAQSIERDETGSLAIYPNPEMDELLSSWPETWAIIESASGERATFGPVPPNMISVMDLADRLKSLTIQGNDSDLEVSARFDRVVLPIGSFSILSGGGGFLSNLHAVLLIGHIAIIVPGITLIILTLIGVPFFIGWCLRSLKDLTGQIDRVDFAARGMRLTDDLVPKEILPVVSGMNEALQRIDAGFEMTERFFMNAAHELRTPIAILIVRLDAIPPSNEHDKLLDVVRRLTVVVDQLLDMERFRQNPMDLHLVDLRAIASGVVADLAPYAIAEGYEIEFDEPDVAVLVHGDVQSLDRMIINLVQNAIQHGGKRGTITVRLGVNGTIEVEDQGAGVAWDRRDRIFEPFYRVNPQGSGAGLGLKMVQDIARRHHGEATLDTNSLDGSRFIVKLPTLTTQEAHAGIRDGRYLAIARSLVNG